MLSSCLYAAYLLVFCLPSYKSVFLSVSPSVWLSAFLSMFFLSVCLYVSLSVYLAVYLSACLSVCLHVNLSNWQPVLILVCLSACQLVFSVSLSAIQTYIQAKPWPVCHVCPYTEPLPPPRIPPIIVSVFKVFSLTASGDGRSSITILGSFPSLLN
jgi:hypothetical protein